MGGGNFLSKLKNREEVEGELEKRKEKEEKKKRVIKHTLNTFMKFEYRKKIHKNREEF